MSEETMVEDAVEETTAEKVAEEVDTAIPSGTMVICDDGVEREVITREEAIEAGSNRYFTGLPCKNGHTVERKIKGYVCTTCARERAKARKKERTKNDPDYKAKMAKKRAERHKWRYANDEAYRRKILDRAKARRAKRAAEKKLNQANAEVIESAEQEAQA